MSIRVLLADDHKILRQVLRCRLESEPDIEVMGEAQDGREALQLAGELAPDVIVMDITMPVMNGIEATRQILAANSGIKILALSMLNDRACVVETLKAGASGYLLKDCAAEELVGAIRTVSAGFPYLCGQVTALVIKDYTQGADVGSGGASAELTRREREVLQLISNGKNAKEIAYILGVSIKTIEAQRMNTMKKLNLFSVAELTKYAVREGLTSIG